MKKLLIFIFVLFTIASTKAQSYLGYTFDNYAGVQGVISNPANIVDSRFRTDINLASISAGVVNDYYGFKVSDFWKNSDYKFERDARKNPSSSNNFQTNIDVMGPSFMFNIKPKHAIALSTRLRSIANVTGINGELFNQFRDNFDSSNGFNLAPQNFNLVGNAWAEFGLSYAAVLFDKDKNFLKGGLTLKYLSGLQNSYVNADNVSVGYIKNSTTNTALNPITTTGNLTYGGSDNLGGTNDLNFNNGSGIGLDLGFVYEYRPNIDELRDKKEANKYLIRVGLALTDLGSINYKNSLERKYNVNRTITEQQYDSQNTGNLLANQYTLVSSSSSSKYILPTSIHLNLDWNMYKKFYLNANVDVNTNGKTAVNANTIANNYSITPRYESKWFSFYLPLNVMEYSGFQAGAGFRLGPVFIGSGSAITNLFSDNSKAIDIHAGLKIPIYQGKTKDKDEDGVLDKNDECPTEAGPAENKGCPYKDSDRDGVLDKDDKCPNIAGEKTNKGCPWEDSDKDGVLDKDDKCPKVFGDAENKGCPYPDSDKDGVSDKEDKCPKVFGTKANNGCPEDKVVEKQPAKPEIKDDIIKKINDFSKTILFDTGKATIKKESFVSLDGIVSVLNEYKNANFKIEGHTDNAGKPAKNLKLSKDRAAAVKKYLVDKGIRNDRLTSDGFGSSKPIASNKTPKGKNLNRRVEINLIK